MARRPTGCVQPGTVTDDDLLACARGEAPRSVVEHVMSCPACRARVAAYTILERQLLAGLFAPSCPESLTLAEFALDLLPTEQRAAVADHLTRCPHCRAVVRSLRSRAGPPDAPAPRTDEEPPGAAGPPRAQATATVAVAASTRTDGTTLHTTAHGVRLSLAVRCACRPDGGAIVGRLEETPDALAATRVALSQDGLCLEDLPLDAAGGFAFTHLVPGLYRIELSLAAAVVVIEPVRVL